MKKFEPRFDMLESSYQMLAVENGDVVDAEGRQFYDVQDVDPLISANQFLASFLQFPRVRDALIAEALKTPYFHLYGGDPQELYMGRWWLEEYKKPGDMGARLHAIVRPDADRHLHDHPYPFTTVILRGGYVEALPISPEGVWGADGREEVRLLERTVDLNPVLFRQATDRHQIVSVLPDTLTLFITGPKSEEHRWGFYTPDGFVHWKEYLKEEDQA